MISPNLYSDDRELVMEILSSARTLRSSSRPRCGEE
jgi:hypothetical protein